MSANLIANRYAKALLALAGDDAQKASQTEAFLAGAASLFEVVETRKVLKSPVMPVDVKRAVLKHVADKTSAGDAAERFSEQLLSAGRVGILPEIYNAYRRMLDEKRGVAHATVTTAEALEPATRTSLQETLSKVFKKNLTIDNKVDRKVLGGLVVEVGNFAIDLSVKAKLASLAEHAQH